MMFDDFDMMVGCEEVYDEGGYHGYEEPSAELEPF